MSALEPEGGAERDERSGSQTRSPGPAGAGAPAAQRADAAQDAAFLTSLPRRLRHVAARKPLTRESLPVRGDSLEDPQLSAATQRVWDAEKATAAALAAQYRALADLYDHDGDYEELTEGDDVDPARAALALRVTINAASWQLRNAYQAVHLLPRTLALLESGVMPSSWFQGMLKKSRKLTDDSRRQLDLTISTWSMDITAERFHTLSTALTELLAHREERTDPIASIEKSVNLLPGQDPGTAILQVCGPVPDILAQWKALDESARAVQAAQRAALRDGGPIPHDPDGVVAETGRALALRALRFALIATAEHDLEGVVVPGERFRINVTVPVLTLLGASDEPGALDGTIPLPAPMARALAGTASVWHRVLTDGASGAFLPLPADRFQPTAAMLEHLRLRNAQCAVPGCTRPTSWASECDHIEECRRGDPGAGGPTEIENLHLLCWQHHLDKTNGLIDPTRLPTPPRRPGRTRWRIGRHGETATVTDDLDDASLRMVADLERAWTCFLTSAPAGRPLALSDGDAPPGPGHPTDRSSPPGRPDPPTPRTPPTPQTPPPPRTPSPPRESGPDPSGPWGEHGPPPF